MKEFGWAIVGPGKIANRFADAIKQLPGTRLVGVHGRDPGRAEAFAHAWPVAGDAAVPVFADLETMLGSDRVDGVYIATPHAFHAATIRNCLLAGKPVLCEKPLVVNAALATELTALSRQRGVFLMEALWTRFLPVYATVSDWLSAQVIGEIRGLQSSFCINVPFNPDTRQFDPAQAGGALLDIGVYNLAMTQWALRAALGSCPELQSLTATGVVGPTGVDHRVAASLEFAGGVVSQFQCGFDGVSDNALRLLGEHGVISVVDRFWEGTTVTLQRPDQPLETVHRPFRINGFEGQIEEAIRCIADGRIESLVIPHADTVTIAAWMDRIRALVGVRYPFE
jgi:predicted dehydrogenase